MQTTAKATRKELTQFITIYQSAIEFSLEKVGLEIFVKHNKKDPDDMLDDINAKLINVCDEYLKSHKLSVDKFQLATIVMDLYTQTISQLDEPFKVIAKESKQIIQDYLEKNKSKRETVERIKKENETLEEEVKQLKEQQATLRIQKTPVYVEEEIPIHHRNEVENNPIQTKKQKTKYK